MKLEIGDRFLHAKEVDLRTNTPKRCVVVQVTADRVYWRTDRYRAPPGASTKNWFPLSEAELHVWEKLPFGM